MIFNSMFIEINNDKLLISNGFEDYQTLVFISKSIPVKFKFYCE